MQQIESRKVQLDEDKDMLRTSLALEQIREMRSTWSDGNFEHEDAVNAYAKEFSKLDLDLTQEDQADVIVKLRESPIREWRTSRV